MSQKLCLRFCLVIAISVCLTNHAWAYKRENRIILRGADKYFLATGEAKSLEVRREIKQKDREELTIELKNVPMKPGTVLVVFFADEEVGKITLDDKRSGQLKLSSETQKHVPLIGPGSVVHIKTPEGRTVVK